MIGAMKQLRAMEKRSHRTRSLLPILALVAGCGGAPEAAPGSDPAATGPTTGSEATSEAATDARWAELDFESRKHYMAEVVVPAFAELFAASGEEVNCSTCHGANHEEVQFQMPNGLAPLDPNHMPFAAEEAHDREVAQFMAERVLPKMAELLQVPPFDPETQSGFGCFGCHAMASGPANGAAASGAEEAQP